MSTLIKYLSAPADCYAEILRQFLPRSVFTENKHISISLGDLQIVPYTFCMAGEDPMNSLTADSYQRLVVPVWIGDWQLPVWPCAGCRPQKWWQAVFILPWFSTKSVAPCLIAATADLHRQKRDHNNHCLGIDGEYPGQPVQPLLSAGNITVKFMSAGSHRRNHIKKIGDVFRVLFRMDGSICFFRKKRPAFRTSSSSSTSVFCRFYLSP